MDNGDKSKEFLVTQKKGSYVNILVTRVIPKYEGRLLHKPNYESLWNNQNSTTDAYREILTLFELEC